MKKKILVLLLFITTIIGFTQCHWWETEVLDDAIEKVEIKSSFNQMFSLDELSKANIDDLLFIEVIDYVKRGTEITNPTSLDVRIRISTESDFTFIKINHGNKGILEFDDEFYFSEAAIITLNKRKYRVVFLKYYLGYNYAKSNKIMKFDFIIEQL